ncbi:MAG TPA: hypothetical protein VFO22_02680 [Candidatus Udaeobacter sp.]|jgi:hypothetical protein|nr:hypothetical protein [Candidatus Udaeobacter sp.]
MQYKHTQNGYLIIGGLLGIAIFLAITGIVAPAGRDGLLISAIIEVILLICAIVFSKLTIKIDGESLEASFATGLIRKKVPLAEIAECEPIRIRWWYGWGIHLTPYGWLYNVSGLDAVVITLRNDGKFALGTDDPQGLVAAIRRFNSVE